MKQFTQKIKQLLEDQETLLNRKNKPTDYTNGWYQRYKNPVLTAAHTPVHWRYDLNEETNPFLMERIGMNAAMNSGAIKWNDEYLLMVRVEGADRKSFFIELLQRCQVRLVGACDGVQENYYAISTERKLAHPLVLQLVQRSAGADLVQ